MTEQPDLGPCCICEGTEAVRTIIALQKRAPTLGRGWGCVVCDLPRDGAYAVVCDGCIDGLQPGDNMPPLRWACRGYPASDGRVPIEELTEPFDHDYARHPELQPGAGEACAEDEMRCRVCGCTDLDACETPDGPCTWVEEGLCSACDDVLMEA